MGTGIAIDQTGIRIIQARENSGDVSINGAGYFPFPEPFDDWQSGFVEYQKTYSFPSGSGYVGVSGKHLSLRHVNLPARNENELRDLVAKEVEQFAGSRKDEELSHAYQDVTPPGSEPDEVTVLLAILRKQWILQAESLLKQHDLELEACVPDAISMFEAFRKSSHMNASSDQITMLAWIGYNSIDLCLIKEGKLFAARNTSGGISTILDAISSGTDKHELYRQFVGRREASIQPEEPLDDDIDQLLDRSMSGLSLRLSSAYDYFQEKFPSIPDRPDRLFLSGQAARIPNLDEKLDDTLDSPIDLFDPSEQFDLSNLPDHKHQSFKAVGPEWTTALGLALAHDSRSDTPLLFKTPTAEENESWWNVEVPAMAGFSILFLAFLIYGLQTYRINTALNETEQQLNTQVSDLETRQRSYSTQSKQTKTFRSKLSHLRALRRNGVSALDAIQEISRVQPSEAVISRIAHPVEGSIRVDGYVLKQVPEPIATVKSFRQKLQSGTTFRQVKRITQDTDSEGKKQFRFDLKY